MEKTMSSSNSLKTFRIRDLHDGSSPQGNRRGLLASTESQGYGAIHDAGHHHISDRSSRHGVVQLSASEYDEIALNHPRAMLTYVDEEDDGEVITVGSSIELSQRLAESVDLRSQWEQDDHYRPMHIFDIRRSNSVTELWKKYEQHEPIAMVHSSLGDEAKGKAKETSYAESNDSLTVHPDESQSLLEAFEAEMAKIMEASGTEEEKPDEPSSARPQSRPIGYNRPPHPADVLAHTVQSMVDGAEYIRSELGSNLPELERQLHNVQRAIPEHVGATVQVALTSLESQVKNFINALNNASRAAGQRTDGDSQADDPTAENPVEGLRNMASEIAQRGRALFAAFGQNAATDQDQSDKEDMPSSSRTEKQEQSNATDKHSSDNSVSVTEPPPVPPKESFENEKEAPASSHRVNCSTTEPPFFADCPILFSPLGQPLRSSQDGKVEHPDSAGRRPRFHPRPPFAAQYRPIHGNPLHQPPPPVACHPSRPRPIPSPFWKSPDSRPFAWPFHLTPPHLDTVRELRARFLLNRGIDSSNMPRSSHKPRDQVASKGNTTESPTDETDSGTDQSADRTLFIGNIGFNVTERMVQDVFASKGFLVRVHLPLDLETGKHAGFGYLHFASIYATKAALEALQGAIIDGHSINLEFSDHSPITEVQISPTATGSAKSVMPNSQTTPFRTQSDRRDPSVASRNPKLLSPRRSIDIHAAIQQARAMEKELDGRSTSKDDAVLAKGKNVTSDAASSSTEDQGKTPAILDEGGEDPEFSARYPSLLPEADRRKSRKTAVSENLPHLSPELEMKRFPPVSQLEAHLLANQRGVSRADASFNTAEVQPTLKNNDIEAPKSDRKDTQQPITPSAPSQTLTDSSAQESQDVPNVRSEHLSSFPEHRHGIRSRSSGPLRRSSSMMHTNPAARLSGPFDALSPDDSQNAVRSLRRRATERHALRTTSNNGWPGPRSRGTGDQAANNNTAERPRSLFNDHPSPSGSFPVEDSPSADPIDAVHADPRRRAMINNCVATLLSLGYGSSKDGGRQRMAVYAAAADGKLLDAIDMIEEERKAYERR